MNLISDILKTGVLYILAHEGGHYLTALAMGCNPKIGIQNWRVVVTFDYDHNKAWQFRLISQAGFGVGMIAGWILNILLIFTSWANPTFVMAYWLVLMAHFLIYPWVALEEANDFNGMCAHGHEPTVDDKAGEGDENNE